MKLAEVFPQLKLDSKLSELEVKGISEDSRLIKNGDIFFVKERRNFDIFSVLPDIEKKTLVFVGDLKHKDKLRSVIKQKPLILVKSIEREFYRVIDYFYGFNKTKVEFIGITGTNGKTTTAHLIHNLLKHNEIESSMIGTVKYEVGGRAYKAVHTTPDYLSLRKLFSRINANKQQYVVMEVSSHGIVQQRIKGINFKSCVFTNLSRDHLDYHKTMGDYFNAKRNLFFHNKDICSVVNIDDYYGRKLLKEIKRAVSYGLNSAADFRAKNINLGKKGSCFNLVHEGKSLAIKTQLLGKHNISNILAAVAVLTSLGFLLSDVVKSIPFIKGVTGRLQAIYPDIFIDYAHTPDALKKVLFTLGEVGYENIICVFGCGGDRDKGKRPVMGTIVGNLARMSIITSDNPRSEDPFEICRQIKKGFKKNNCVIEVNREHAIEKAIKLKQKYKNSCVLVAGKGHEEYQIVGDKREPFSDERVIKKLMKINNENLAF
jgi:UDP-N-acetylmuramoyl-L-alanyl-D-glutamate--2,6-diaminopimelate ligase